MNKKSKKILFIVNPTAGGGKCRELFAQAEEFLIDLGISYEVKISKYPGHSIKLADESIANGENFIVAVGGDGTVNEISSVLCQIEGVRFGILPFGTGNDIAGALGIPAEPKKAVEVLLNGTEHAMDMGMATELWGERRHRKFINIAGQGFDVDVLNNTEKHKNHKNGLLTYFLGIIDAILNKRKLHVRIICDKLKEEMDILLAVIANGSRFGGGMLATPLAKTDDGLFDVCIIENVNTIQFISMLPAFLKGKHLNFKQVRYFKTDCIRIETDDNFDIEMDGEIMLKTSVEYRIIPGALKVIRV